MLETPLTPEAAEALVKRMNDREVAGRSENALNLGPTHHECVAEWRNRIKANLRRLPSRKSH